MEGTIREYGRQDNKKEEPDGNTDKARRREFKT